jgi:hypothetical protein
LVSILRYRSWSQSSRSDAHTTRHLTTRHLTARHLTTRHFSTRHPDNSPPWQLVTLTTRHSDNSPPDNSPLWQLATLTTRHHYNSSPWRICLDQSLYFDYFLLQCLHCILLPGFFIQYFADFLFWSMRSNIYYFILIMYYLYTYK